MKTSAWTSYLNRVWLFGPKHRADREPDSPSQADDPESEGRHKLGLAEVFRRRFNAALAERRSEGPSSL